MNIILRKYFKIFLNSYLLIKIHCDGSCHSLNLQTVLPPLQLLLLTLPGIEGAFPVNCDLEHCPSFCGDCVCQCLFLQQVA